ncbi:class II histone deacetylase, partial [Enterobacter hormaechei]|nr:class II histone deacetylase [Enterobacter hormaechei]
MLRKTGFFFDELCFWHHSGLQHVLTFPVGGWVQPPTSAGHAESPETKRRMKNLIDVSGLSHSLQLRGAEPLDDATLKRVHTEDYLQRFKSLSDQGGGMLGPEAP